MKELAVVAHIRETFPLLQWINDKTVVGGSSRRRPDILLDLGEFVIIIEIDEGGSSHSVRRGTDARNDELRTDLAEKSCVVIHFNPDSYSYFNGSRHVKSCWSYDDTGKVYVPPDKEAEWRERLFQLEERIRFHLANPFEAHFLEEYLFFA